MKILHTSDWHLGRSLFGRKRYAEFSAFLEWLTDLIESEGVDALLVAGDIFDTGTPSNRAQELYYQFLCRVSQSSCRHIVVIAGNHDSPTFLNAPKELLRALNVYVVGTISEDLEDEIIVLNDATHMPQAIVCAIPYLRDRDIRSVEAGESLAEKNLKLVDGVQKHYAKVCEIAEKKQSEYGDIPIIGMGHLFTTGAKTVDGDGVRELYVGSLAHIGKDSFPACLNYLALGHLHVPQMVSDAKHILYSGSPIAMGFGEAKQKKRVLLVEFNDRTPLISEIAVPCFQELEKISGGIDNICARIEALKARDSKAWLEIEYTGIEIIGNLQGLMNKAIADTDMEIRKIKNQRIVEKALSQNGPEETLENLNVNDVFLRCLDSHKVSPEERPALIYSYNEIIKSLQEDDLNEL